MARIMAQDNPPTASSTTGTGADMEQAHAINHSQLLGSEMAKVRALSLRRRRCDPRRMVFLLTFQSV